MTKRVTIPKNICELFKIDEKTELVPFNADLDNDTMTFKVLRDVKKPKAEKGGIKDGREGIDIVDEKSGSDKRKNSENSGKISWLK